MKPFADRRDAGRQLAERLAARRPRASADLPVVIGMARGGVPVAAEIARRLRAPLDTIVVRKIGCPWQPELGVGALAEGGVVVLDDVLIEELGITTGELDATIAAEERELARRVAHYRGATDPVPLIGREVILVDDGLATGGTARAAIRSIRARGAVRVILAVPVAPRDTLDRMRPLVDDVAVLDTPTWFGAIGLYYVDFQQTSDEEVVAALSSAPAHAPGGGAPIRPRPSASAQRTP
ncbi:MAG: phosphoribosyltransferase family protein [Chloroflexota bacterium]|jgi:putative phosphoribosyl transferase|nr:phosphoribosyltransferase family protein [Chloroflexota bacterium]MDH5242631.1 phosphoribosyltransferase family protein [Chloroflexota bacterium]